MFKKFLSDRKFVEEMTEHNYELGKQFYSFTVLERQSTGITAFLF